MRRNQPVVLLIGTEPARMTRLRRTFESLRAMGATVRIFVPYDKPRGTPRVLKGIIRYVLITLQVAIQRADIYHFFNIPDVVGLPLIFKRGVFVYDVRSPWFSSIKETIGGGPLWRIAEIIERLMTRAANIVLTACTPLAKRAKRWGAKRVVVVPNYPPADFAPTTDRETMRRVLGLGDHPTVLYLGKLSRLEGSELLKGIIEEVLESVPNAMFLIVGDGPARESVERFVEQQGLSERVVFTGWVPHSLVADYIIAADICLLPRRHTSFSPYTSPENILKAGEYIALGKPVVAPKMGGFADAEFPVIPAEPGEMAQAVVEFLRNPKQVPEFQRPTWEISHARLQRVYSAIGAVSR
ncbi:MAG: glycosyltransferase [Candidatus Thorarchaeota archaeon]